MNITDILDDTIHGGYTFWDSFPFRGPTVRRVYRASLWLIPRVGGGNICFVGDKQIGLQEADRISVTVVTR